MHEINQIKMLSFQAINMIGNILDEFKLMIREVDWMDDISKSKAVAKVKNFSNY